MRIEIPQITVIMLITCDLIRALSATAINSQKSDTQQEPFTVYYKDHEVTESKARDSLRLMNQGDLERPAHCAAFTCTDEYKNYCHSKELLKDHCCCNQSHKKDPLYFIPHECYVTRERCQVSFGDRCSTVMYIRTCCCDAQLKRHWKSVLAHGHMIKSDPRCHWILVTIVLLISSLYLR